jgi:hypothetical protein
MKETISTGQRDTKPEAQVEEVPHAAMARSITHLPDETNKPNSQLTHFDD